MRCCITSGDGPQNIKHVAGVRPALIEQDARTTALFNGKAETPGFNLGKWLGAKGSVTITPSADGKAKISARFANLRSGGAYNLFGNHFDQPPIGFTPRDGAGKANNFVADKNGAARARLMAPQTLTHANALSSRQKISWRPARRSRRNSPSSAYRPNSGVIAPHT